jgi:hypothetical protein
MLQQSRDEGSKMRIIVALAGCLLLQGCVTSIVKDVVTAPIKIVSKTADVLTTSQSESDEKRGKEMRKKEERLGKLARDRDKAVKKCEHGDGDACQNAEAIDAAIEAEQDRVL